MTVTTNGVLLKEQVHDACGGWASDAVNISLDTLDPAMYASVARRDCAGSSAGGAWRQPQSCPGLKVKINCVPLKGINENQWIGLAGIAKDRPIDVRFIEMMPVGLGRDFRGSSQEDVLERLREAFGPERPCSGHFGNGPAQYVSFAGFEGKIGFISAISHKFCSGCNRIRLTAEGFLKPCLQYADGEDVRALVRSGASDRELLQAVEKAIYRKPACHHFRSGRFIGI